MNNALELFERIEYVLIFVSSDKELAADLVACVLVRSRIEQTVLRGWFSKEDRAEKTKYLDDALVRAGLPKRESQKVAIRINDIEVNAAKPIFNMLYAEEVQAWKISLALIEFLQQKGRTAKAFNEWLPLELAVAITKKANNEISEVSKPPHRFLCVGEASLPIALLASVGSEVVLEIGYKSELTSLITQIPNTNIKVVDPESPADFFPFGMDKFDAAFVARPWSAKVAPRIAPNTNRRYASLSSEAIAIPDVLGRTKGDIYCIVPQSWLMKTVGDDAELKAELCQSGRLIEVIQFPERILLYTIASPAIVTLKAEPGKRSIRLIDASGGQFINKNSRSNWRVQNLESWVENKELKASEGWREVQVSQKDIEKNDYNLHVARYISLDEELLENIEKFYKKSERVVELRSLVNFVSCQAIKAKKVQHEDVQLMEGNAAVYELSPSDISKQGFIDNQDEIQCILPTPGQEDRIRKQTIEKYDIVFCTKGSIGKCALVTELPNRTLVANQSFIILRLDLVHKTIRPEVLQKYLCSALAQALIKTLKTGTAVPFIKKQDLESLDIPIPTVEDQESIVSDYYETVALLEKVRGLEEEISKRSARYWPTAN